MTPATQRARPTRRQAEILRAMAGGAELHRHIPIFDGWACYSRVGGIPGKVYDAAYETLRANHWIKHQRQWNARKQYSIYVITDAGRKAIGEQA